VADELHRIGHELKPFDIVLVNTRAGSRIGQDDYLSAGIGMGREATLYLTSRGVKVCGIDAWGWDGPLHFQAEAARAAGRPGIFWAAHQADLEYCQIERLCNLGELPPTGFTVACFPLRIVGGSAGPTRAVAILDD